MQEVVPSSVGKVEENEPFVTGMGSISLAHFVTDMGILSLAPDPKIISTQTVGGQPLTPEYEKLLDTKWGQYVDQCVCAIGPDDAKAHIDRLRALGIIGHPRFEPVPCMAITFGRAIEEALERRTGPSSRSSDNNQGVWVHPHPYHQRKLGYFVIRRGTDWVAETMDLAVVRRALGFTSNL